jgi:hypothetical protein
MKFLLKNGLEIEFEELQSSELFWSDKLYAVKIELTDSQLALYDVVGAVPHITLAKPHTAKWQDLGPFVKQCDSLTD